MSDTETHLQIAQRVWPEARWDVDPDGCVWGYMPAMMFRSLGDWRLENLRGGNYCIGPHGRAFATVEEAFIDAKRRYTTFARDVAATAGLTVTDR